MSTPRNTQTVTEALALIRNWNGSHLDLIIAAGTMMDNCELDDSIKFSDMLRLLDFPDSIPGEMGARVLYVRTGRDNLGWQNGGSNGLPFITDKQDWITYLIDHGFATAEELGEQP